MSNLHTYCCCILPYNTKNNSLALLVLSGVEWAFWNNFVIFKTWKTHLSRSVDLRKKWNFQHKQQSTSLPKKTGSLMCSDSNTMHALCVQIVFLYRFTIFFYTFILPEINITLCFQSQYIRVRLCGKGESISGPRRLANLVPKSAPKNNVYF